MILLLCADLGSLVFLVGGWSFGAGKLLLNDITPTANKRPSHRMRIIPFSSTMSYPDGSGSGSSSAIVPTSRGANNGGRKQKQPRQILKEEEYQQTLSQIVQRDYYPALPSLHRDMAVLERRGTGDVSGAVAVRRAYRRVAEEEEKESEAERQEDERARTQSGGTRKRPRPLERESVTGFHDRATSEDNEEFDRVTRREEDERIDRMRALSMQGREREGCSRSRLILHIMPQAVGLYLLLEARFWGPKLHCFLRQISSMHL